MNLGKPEIAGPVILVISLCSLIGSLIYKLVKGAAWSDTDIIIPLVIVIVLTI